jgi:RecA-family ATPase
MKDPFEKIADEWDEPYRFDEARFSHTIEELARKNGAKANGHALPVSPETSKPSLPWIDTLRWDSEPCPEREWAIKDRVPLRQVTLFSGEGAIGKSNAELMCSVAHVTGKDWFGSLPEPGGAFYIGCEDDEAELRIRLTPIARHYGTTFEQLKADGFHFTSLAGQDAVLAAPDRSGIIKPTKLFDCLYEQAGDLKPKHIGIDTAADVFAGNENDRSQVRQFISVLRKLAIVSDGSVVLLSHPSLTGINSGSGLSGSTAWHNSVRSRFYMTAPKLEQGEQPDTDLRELQFKKSNYGPIASNIVVRYQGGLFLPERGVSSLDKLAREQRAEETFLALLGRYERDGRNVSDKAAAHNYAPTMFCKERDADGFRKADFADAMRRLFEAGKIHVQDYGRPSRPAFRLRPGRKED